MEQQSVSCCNFVFMPLLRARGLLKLPPYFLTYWYFNKLNNVTIMSLHEAIPLEPPLNASEGDNPQGDWI